MPLSNTILFLLVLYFLVLVALSMLKSRYLPGKTIYLLRAFFPSWKFFEDFGEVPILLYRTSPSQEQDFGPWQPCLEPAKRQIKSLFLNPHGNFLLVCGSLLQQLISDLEEIDEAHTKKLEHTVSYQLTKNLVRYQISKMNAFTRISRFQFKVALNLDDLLISPIYEA